MMDCTAKKPRLLCVWGGGGGGGGGGAGGVCGRGGVDLRQTYISTQVSLCTCPPVVNVTRTQKKKSSLPQTLGHYGAVHGFYQRGGGAQKKDLY